MLNGFGTVVNSLGQRVKPYLPQICGTIKWRLNNKSAKVRQQAADLIARIAVVMKACHEEQLMGHLGVVSGTLRDDLRLALPDWGFALSLLAVAFRFVLCFIVFAAELVCAPRVGLYGSLLSFGSLLRFFQFCAAK
jgi:hypothetical protein